jgi:hypothetical protein
MRQMHALFTTSLALTLAGAALPAQPTLRPAPSGRGTSEVTLSYPREEGQPAPAGARPVTIRLDFGQPHLSGRARHTDSLVPYAQPWRTGANAPTTLTTEVDLVLGGVELPTGKYVLWTLPARSGWKLIIQKGEAAERGGDYNAAHDVARVDLRRRELHQPVESLTMWLIPSTQPGPARGELRLAWGMSEVATEWRVK